jgi:hypothetical protein
MRSPVVQRGDHQRIDMVPLPRIHDVKLKFDGICIRTHVTLDRTP